MIIKSVNVIYKRRVDLGGFNSADISAMISADVDEGDDMDQSMKALWSMVKENVKAQIVPLVKESRAGSATIQEYFLGLPIQDQSKQES